MGFWKEYTEVKYHSYHIMAEDTCYPHEVTGDVNLAHLCKVAFAKYLFCKVTLSSFPTLFFGSESLSIARLQCVGVVKLNYLLKGVAYMCVTGTPSVMKIFPFFPIYLYIYLFIHSFI